MSKEEQGKSESRIQGECVKWFNETYPAYRGLLFSVHNNASNEVAGSVALALGRWPGVSDLIFLSPFGALCIEMKDDRGKQSQRQANWELTVQRNGYRYLIVRSQHQFKFYVEQWLERKGVIDEIYLLTMYHNFKKYQDGTATK